MCSLSLMYSLYTMLLCTRLVPADGGRAEETVFQYPLATNRENLHRFYTSRSVCCHGNHRSACEKNNSVKAFVAEAGEVEHQGTSKVMVLALVLFSKHGTKVLSNHFWLYLAQNQATMTRGYCWL